jgi:tRNA (guanine37-N1)-methyltransferase
MVRVAGYEPVTGGKMRTICRESGFRYHVDLGDAFFTTRLASEHDRIAAQVEQGERVLVPFAGVGPFVIPVAARGAGVIALDINPVACRLLARNLVLNHLEGSTAVVRADALTIGSLICSTVDRAIIPTPYGLDRAFEPVQEVVRPGGSIHFYTFQNRQQAAILSEKFEASGFTVERCRRCGNVAPSVSRWVYDLEKT